MNTLSDKTYPYEQMNIHSNYKTSIMAPLHKITDWEQFKKQLITLKNYGIYSITTDIWWGDVEKEADNLFDWSYYKQYAFIVRETGLKWIPIISTHQCGGNVGDDSYIAIPEWLWDQGTEEELCFKDEDGFINKECLSLWWNGLTQQYNDLYESFANNFIEFKDIIVKIYLSGGPAGELRYPSYNGEAGFMYPNRGKLQCYSKSAKKSFILYLENKYNTVENVNFYWNSNLRSFDEISPPNDKDNFFINGVHTPYGIDFMDWYQLSLTNHFNIIAKLAHKYFDNKFQVTIGAKIAGVHWLMSSYNMPHAAEYCTGYYDYNKIIEQFANNNIEMTFTCLEMNNNNSFPEYSNPQDLVHNITSIALSNKVVINGENALSIYNEEYKYHNIANFLFKYGFKGFTLLRLHNVVDWFGNPTEELKKIKNILII